MVGMMKKWRPWPPLSSKKFEARVVVQRVKGLSISKEAGVGWESVENLTVEIKWKGSAKMSPLSSLRKRGVRRNFTKGEALRGVDGVVEWHEEFHSLCNFSAHKGAEFLPWEVAFTVFNGSSIGPTTKVPAIATASLNLAEYASSAKEKDIEISVPLEVSSSLCIQGSPVLCLSLNLVELRNVHEASSETTQKPVPVMTHPALGEVLHDKIAASPLRASLEKVKIFKGLSSRGHKKTCHEDEGSDSRSPVRSEDSYPVDTDSFGDSDELGESEEGTEDSNMRKSFSYEALAYANHAGGLYYSNTSGSEDEDLIYYSHQKSDPEDATRSALDQSTRQSSKRGILPWGKRRLSFKSPKSKGEPLLKKHYGEEGGDDIDFDRRQLSSSDESSTGSTEAQSPVSEFGDDNFAVGSWESKEIVSRDGEMKLKTQVFFASIDQRDEQAAGESACTALVAVIADWFHINREELPIKSQLDSLIREGSLEWRKLCENESYRERFPDKHFDLETVLQAKVRPLSVSQEKSFIGFFHPEGIEDEGFDFLKGAMSFDNIWDEISKPCLQDNIASGDSLVYIVSWNDHFFVLKVEQDAYYIIDTLGERLYEGCNQAYILKFDRDTTISRLAKETEQAEDNKPGSDKTEQNDTKETAFEGKTIVSTSTNTSASDKKEGESTNDEEPKESEQEAIMCRGREACKEYIKSFLAAIPIRELQVDLKKGLMASTPLHQRLQIEFHYTKSLELPSLHLTANPSEAQSILAE
nr:uncharacterized protein LOC109187089 isoform X2 [Ipomoea batatas]